MDFVVMTQKEHREIKDKIEILAQIILEKAEEIRAYRKVLKEIKHKSHKEFMDR